MHHPRLTFRAPRRVTFPLALALLAAACGGDGGGGGGTAPDATLRVVAALGPQEADVTVSDGGAPVAGAGVSVNGTDAVMGAAGAYAVGLPAAVPAGGVLSLEVTAAGAAVQGTATVPHAPVVTAPADGAVYATSQEIAVAWTSATDPDRWEVELSQGGTVTSFAVADGAARGFTVPDDTLAAGAWTLRVIALTDGTLSGDTEVGSAMDVAVAVASAPELVLVVPVRIRTTGFNGTGGGVEVTQGGVVVDGATVTVNGEPAIQGLPGTNYHVTLADPVEPGGQVHLEVSFGDVVITGVATIPEPPQVTAPADGAVLAAGGPIEVTWTSPGDVSNGWIVTLHDGTGTWDVSTTDGTARPDVPRGHRPRRRALRAAAVRVQRRQLPGPGLRRLHDERPRAQSGDDVGDRGALRPGGSAGRRLVGWSGRAAGPPAPPSSGPGPAAPGGDRTGPSCGPVHRAARGAHAGFTRPRHLAPEFRAGLPLAGEAGSCYLSPGAAEPPAAGREPR